MSEQASLELIAQISRLGTPALLVLILIGGYKQWWVWGHQMRAMSADRDFWRSAALRQTHLLEHAVGTDREGMTP